MTNSTQRKWVEAQMTEYGYITRNTALRNFVSRLGAIVCLMKKDGWEIRSNYFETEGGGRDFIYVLISKPL